MGDQNRKIVVTGNWKMYKTNDEAVEFVRALIPQVAELPEQIQVQLAVPFTAIQSVSEVALGSSIIIGAQNMHDVTEGAFTGEIGAKMLREAGARFVLLGHSERRQIFHESSSFINKKVKRALDEGLQPILCVGETLSEREAEKTQEVIASQLQESLMGLTAPQAEKLVLAYEPVWAIGTDKIATPVEAQEAHLICRKEIEALFGEAVASQIIIQYGGSVQAKYVQELLQQTDIDGFLVGRASLGLESFIGIIQAASVGLHAGNSNSH